MIASTVIDVYDSDPGLTTLELWSGQPDAETMRDCLNVESGHDIRFGDLLEWEPFEAYAQWTSRETGQAIMILRIGFSYDAPPLDD